MGKPSQGRGDCLDGTEGSQNHRIIWVFRDLQALPTPLPAMGHLPLSQVAPNPTQTLPGAFPGLENPQRNSVSSSPGDFCREYFPPQLHKSSPWQSFGFEHKLRVCPDVNPRIPPLLVPPRASPKPFPKVVFSLQRFSVTRNEDPHQPRVFFTSRKKKLGLGKCGKCVGRAEIHLLFFYFLRCSKRSLEKSKLLNDSVWSGKS